MHTGPSRHVAAYTATVLLLPIIAGLSGYEAELPRESWAWTPHDRSHAEFHNVLLVPQGVVFFLPDELLDKPLDEHHIPPDLQHLLQWQFWSSLNNGTFQVQIATSQNRSEFPDRCKQWVDTPTILYAGIEWDHLNIYHFFMDNFIRFFSTATELGLFDVDAFVARDSIQTPTSSEANLNIIQRRPESWSSKFNYMFDYITPIQWSWPDGVGACFSKLVVGADDAMMTYADAKDEEDQAHRTSASLRFQRYAIKTLQRHAKLKGEDLSHFEPETSGRVQIRFVSRDKTAHSSRAILNEDSVIKALRRHYKDTADVRPVYFNRSLTLAMMAIQETDILIGAHGAGLTNALWLRPDRVVIQLLPYGWERSPGKERGYKQLAQNMNCTHLAWRNMKADNGYFSRRQFEKVPHLTYTEHPTEAEVQAGGQYNEKGMLHDHYLYQDTVVDIPSFIQVVDEAMKIIHSNQQSAVSS